MLGDPRSDAHVWVIEIHDPLLYKKWNISNTRWLEFGVQLNSSHLGSRLNNKKKKIDLVVHDQGIEPWTFRSEVGRSNPIELVVPKTLT